MEGFLKGDDFLSAVVERRQFQGILIGFRTGVHEEQLVVFFTGYFTQFLRQLLLKGMWIELE